MHKRQVDGKDQVEVGVGCRKCGMDSAQRAPMRKDVLNDRRIHRKFAPRPNDDDVLSKGTQRVHSALQQSLTIEHDERFLGSHSSALAAGEHECGNNIFRRLH